MKHYTRKNFSLYVIVTIQGQPRYYKCRNLVHALWKYAKLYLKFKKYSTANVELKQRFQMYQSEIA